MRNRTRLACLLLVLTCAASAWGLSRERPTPGIFFPKNYDKKKAQAIETVLQDKQFHYLNGLTSYWEPAFGTILVYDGDIKSLQIFIARLMAIPGMHLRLTFSKDLSKETGSALSAGAWWVKYSHVTPDTLEIRINLAARQLDLSELGIAL